MAYVCKAMLWKGQFIDKSVDWTVPPTNERTVMAKRGIHIRKTHDVARQHYIAIVHWQSPRRQANDARISLWPQCPTP